MFKNEIYEHDYAEEHARRTASQPKIYDEIFERAIESGFFKAYNDAMRALPKYIVPEDQAAYEDLLPRLDAVAQKRGGKIKGIVDYEKWDAHIYVDLPFFEFSSTEDFSLLADIAAKTHLVTFSVTENDKIHLSIMINYFNELGYNDGLIDDLILKDDALTELLISHDFIEGALLGDAPLGEEDEE